MAERHLDALQQMLTLLRPKLDRATLMLTHGLVLQSRRLPSMMLPQEEHDEIEHKPHSHTSQKLEAQQAKPEKQKATLAELEPG